MKLSLNVINGTKLYNKNANRHLKLNRELPFDTFTFTSLKKSQFKGIDLFIVNKFKAPIEKFNDNNDFQNWCKIKINEIKRKEYTGRRQETSCQRKEILKEWYEYVLNENDAYNDSVSLMILDSITQNLDNDSDTIPPVLNKRILADTIEEISIKLKENNKERINFNKLYQMNLQKQYLEELKPAKNSDSANNYSGWIVIPSKVSDPEHFDDNVLKLKTLSHDNWCTKSFNAEPYLKKGDFHIYMEQGKPKLGVRFENNVIMEIQGEKNNSVIPVKYLDIAESYVKDNEYRLNRRTEAEFEQAKIIKEEADKLEKKLKEQGFTFKTAPIKQLFETIGIKVKEDKDGKLIISEYKQPSSVFTYDDIGIDENKIFLSIVETEGNADFKNSNVTNLGNLKTIGGNADFRDSKIKDFGSLTTIKGNANFSSLKIASLCNLESIEGDADFNYTKAESLGSLKTISGNADFRNSKIKSLDNLETIGGNASFLYSEIESLGKLKSIIGNANFSYCAKSKASEI